jgi:two-component system, NarL family, invasion response regulator UvrY
VSTDAADVRVMVVDDHESFRSAAREMVDHMAGFAIVAEATSGEEAVSLAATARPDLVVMDINMGAMDGIEATTHITAVRPATVVVLVSTYELADLPAAARTSGAAAYLNKDDVGGRVLRRIWESGGDPTFRPTGPINPS